MKLVYSLVVTLISLSTLSASASDAWNYWAVSDKTSTQVVDHQLWGDLLSRYVTDNHPSGINRFAYRQVSNADKIVLNEYVQSLASIDARKYNKQQQMVYWINLYNALTVYVVLRHPSEESILDMDGGLFSTGPWNKTVTTINQHKITLNDIEHRILRPIFSDHRVHFALNCASLGCPNLAAEAFDAERLERMLAVAESVYLTHARGVRFDDDTLVVSSIFNWYREDFAIDEDTLRVYLAEHLDTKLADRVRAHEGKIVYQYDWQLNQP